MCRRLSIDTVLLHRWRVCAVITHRNKGSKLHYRPVSSAATSTTGVLTHDTATAVQSTDRDDTATENLSDDDDDAAGLLSNAKAKPIDVEQVALLHYESQGWTGVHTERYIICTLLELLISDIIWDPSSSASSYHGGCGYLHRLQPGPCELIHCGSNFASRRRRVLNARLAAIAKFTDEQLRSELDLCWDESRMRQQDRHCW